MTFGGGVPCGTREGYGGITVDRQPAYPVVPHPKCEAVGTCQGSCSEEGH